MCIMIEEKVKFLIEKFGDVNVDCITTNGIWFGDEFVSVTYIRKLALLLSSVSYECNLR